MTTMSQVRERPILFSGPMVRAILDGRKTQTRRVVKNPDWLGCLTGDCPHDKQTECDASLILECPYGVPGDRLWVRETWGPAKQSHAVPANEATYVCFPDGSQMFRNGKYYQQPIEQPPRAGTWPTGWKWKPSIHMPRWASRIMLEITEVRVQRVQEISEDDALAEGFSPLTNDSWRKPGTQAVVMTAAERFAKTWDELNGKRGYPWASNPFVWCLSFRRIQP